MKVLRALMKEVSATKARFTFIIEGQPSGEDLANILSAPAGAVRQWLVAKGCLDLTGGVLVPFSVVPPQLEDSTATLITQGKYRGMYEFVVIIYRTD